MPVYKCINCNKIFDHKGHYDNHVLYRKNKCKTSQDIVTNMISNDELVDSIESKTSEHICPFCNTSFVRKNNLKRHLLESCMSLNSKMRQNNVSRPNTPVFNCEYCNELFKQKSDLKVHMEVCLQSPKNINSSTGNTYKLNTKVFGKHIFKGEKLSGDIYVIKSDNSTNDIYEVGVTTNLYNTLKRYRVNKMYDSHLKYYAPCKNTKIGIDIIRKALDAYKIENDVYEIKLDNLNDILIQCLKDTNESTAELYIPEAKQKYKSSIKCQYCDESFYRYNDLELHMAKKCTRKSNELILSNEESQLELELDTALAGTSDSTRAKIKKIIQKNKTNVNITNINSNNKINNIVNNNQVTNNQVTNNINIVIHGKEDLSQINDNVYREFLLEASRAIPNFIKYVHFNENLTENHNVYIANKREKYVQVFTKNGWQPLDKDTIVETLLVEKMDILVRKCKVLFEKEIYEHEHEDKDLDKRLERFLRIVDKINNFEDEESSNYLKQLIAEVLYIYREIPLKTKKTVEKQKKMIEISKK